jgi:diacylglycerol kinase (ATP)
VTVLSKKWMVILNPTSGNGKSKKKWPKINHFLKQYGFHYEVVFTEYSKHSISLVHQAIEKGITNIICIGGDGTLHNIVNGIMSQNKIPSNRVNVGMIPIGTGNDWVKTHHISRDIHNAIKTIVKDELSYQDIGKIELNNKKAEHVYFNNIAGVGFDAHVVSKVNKYKKIGSLSYLFGALIGLFSFKNFNASVYVNSKIISSKTLMVLIGLGKYSGGGMQLTKEPNAFDGLFDVSIAKNLSKIEIIRNLSHLFNGKITSHKKVESIKTTNVEITINEENFPFVQADGELVGKGNLIITIIPKALSFYS